MNEINIRRQAVNKMYMICLDVFLLGGFFYVSALIFTACGSNYILKSSLIGMWGYLFMSAHFDEQNKRRSSNHSNIKLKLLSVLYFVSGFCFLGGGSYVFLF